MKKTDEGIHHPAVHGEHELKIRATWFYYVEGLTQEKIADALGVSRLKVHRILAAARDEGVIQFRIRDSLSNCLSLEQRLKAALQLTEAIVLPSALEDANSHVLIGQATSLYLENNVREGDIVGVGWGRTLKAAISQLHPRPIGRTTVVSLLGGLTHAQPLNPTECAWDFAQKIGAECYLLPVPVYADQPESRESFMLQRSVREVINRARRADLALLSVGSLSAQSPIANYGFIDMHEIEDLQAAGATGDLLCTFLDRDGTIIDHPVNRRVCAFPIDELQKIPKVVLASGGREKVAVLRSALQLTKASVLITDEAAAKGLLGE